MDLYKNRMDAKPKRPLDDLRSKLLKCAADIISKKGISKLTMRSLGNRVGVSRTAPYRHFENKEALLMAIAEEGFINLTMQYREINNNKSLDSLSRLQNIGFAYIEFAIRNPGAFKLMFGQEIIQHQRSDKLCSVSRGAFDEYLIAVKAFQEETNINRVDYSILANYFWATVHGLAVLLIDDQIQVSGQNVGLPTLLSGEMPDNLGTVQTMIAFSKNTIIKFWDVILFGVSQNGNVGDVLK